MQTRLPLCNFSPFTHQPNDLLSKLWQKLRYKFTLWHMCCNYQSVEVQSLMNCWLQWIILLLTPRSNKPLPPGSSLFSLVPHIGCYLLHRLIFSLNCKHTWEILPNYAQFLTVFLLSLLNLHLFSWSRLSSSTQAPCWHCLHHNSSTRLVNYYCMPTYQL